MYAIYVEQADEYRLDDINVGRLLDIGEVHAKFELRGL